MKRKLIYVAIDGIQSARIIRTDRKPTQPEDAGGAIYCIGPFRTLRGARCCIDTLGSPCLQHVQDWEAYAASMARKEIR